MGAVRMRNAKPAAKESRLYDHASTRHLKERSYSTVFGRGSCEMRRSQEPQSGYRTSRAFRSGAAKAETTGSPSKNSKKSCVRQNAYLVSQPSEEWTMSLSSD